MTGKEELDMRTAKIHQWQDETAVMMAKAGATPEDIATALNRIVEMWARENFDAEMMMAVIMEYLP